MVCITDKQQNIDTHCVEASSNEVTSSTTQPQPHPAQPSTARLTTTAARRRDLKPSLMSHISGVHRLSSGVDGSGSETAAHLPKYGVDCPDKTLLDEVSNA